MTAKHEISVARCAEREVHLGLRSTSQTEDLLHEPRAVAGSTGTGGG